MRLAFSQTPVGFFDTIPKFRENTANLGYCNGNLGYLPTQQAYSEGGYEPWTIRFAPVTGKIFVAEVEKMLISFPIHSESQ